MNDSSSPLIISAENKAEKYLFFSCKYLSVCEILDWIETCPASILVMDFSQVKTIHSNLLFALVKAYRKAEALGKTLLLSSTSPELNMMLEISQLDRLFLMLSPVACLG